MCLEVKKKVEIYCIITKGIDSLSKNFFEKYCITAKGKDGFSEKD